jgi:DNA-cytosine methyltransferase
MNVLSLFDGISCARIALENLGLKIDNYYASEIDKYAINVSKKNYSDIIHLGDINTIKAKSLPKIDLLVGGSPCQDLSNAQQGKGLKGSKSSLFYEYIRLLNEVKPTFFLLENVKNKWGSIMSDFVGVDYIEINSSVFSAQSRPRFYWTNLDYNLFPNNLSNFTIEHIIENNVDEKYSLNKKGLDQFIIKTKLNDKITKEGINKIFELPKEIHKDNERQRRVYSLKSKSPTILARADTTKILLNSKVRKLTPLECERLQGIPDNYTSFASDTQRYKMIGNAFTVPVIEHFMKGLNKRPITKKRMKQTTLF